MTKLSNFNYFINFASYARALAHAGIKIVHFYEKPLLRITTTELINVQAILENFFEWSVHNLDRIHLNVYHATMIRWFYQFRQ